MNQRRLIRALKREAKARAYHATAPSGGGEREVARRFYSTTPHDIITVDEHGAETLIPANPER